MDGLCQRWGCTPSQIMREDAAYVLRLLRLISVPESVPLETGPPDPIVALGNLQEVMSGN